MKFKDLLTLKEPLGKKIITVAYYAVVAFAAVTALMSIVEWLHTVFNTSGAWYILKCIWGILVTPAIFAVNVVIARAIADFMCNIVDIKDNTKK